MKNIYIIRHGETDLNKNHQLQGRGVNASLNEKGRQQALAVASKLALLPISKIVTSSLNRAIESAQPIAALKKLQIECYPELDEMSFGDLEGKVFESVKEDIRYLQSNWETGKLDVAPLNGESPLQVFERANAKIQDLLEKSEDKEIVIMIHGRLIRILLSVWLKYGLEKMHDVKHSNGAINYLQWSDGVFTTMKLNDTSHLK